MTATPLSSEKLRDKWQRHLSCDQEISLSEYKVAIAISWHFNRKEGGTARPGINLLAKLTGLHRRTVIRGLKQLEARGHMRIRRTRKRNRNEANRYEALFRPVNANGVVAELRHHPSGRATPPP